MESVSKCHKYSVGVNIVCAHIMNIWKTVRNSKSKYNIDNICSRSHHIYNLLIDICTQLKYINSNKHETWYCFQKCQSFICMLCAFILKKKINLFHLEKYSLVNYNFQAATASSILF